MSPRLHHLQKCFWLGRIIRDFLIFLRSEHYFCRPLPCIAQCLHSLGNGQWAVAHLRCLGYDWGKSVAQLGCGQRGRVTSSQCNSVAHCPLPSNASSLITVLSSQYFGELDHLCQVCSICTRGSREIYEKKV